MTALQGRLTHSLADPRGGVHLVAVVTLTLVASLQVDADLTADARVHTLVDVWRQQTQKTTTTTVGTCSDDRNGGSKPDIFTRKTVKRK